MDMNVAIVPPKYLSLNIIKPNNTTVTPVTKQQRIESWDKVKDKYKWHAGVDYRLNPHLYNIGKGEQGVLICEPYKSEICLHWAFKTPDEARISSDIIYNMFLNYLKIGDFVGADMARKFLQMGFTRSRRYANHKSGRKYSTVDGTQLPLDQDPIKAMSATIFLEKWRLAKDNQQYITLKKSWPNK